MSDIPAERQSAAGTQRHPGRLESTEENFLFGPRQPMRWDPELWEKLWTQTWPLSLTLLLD